MDVSQWNNLVIQHGPRSGAFLQSWEWGEFQKAVGRRVLRIAADDEQAAAQLIEYPIRASFFGFDLPRGPVGELGQAAVCLSNAIHEAQKTAALFVHVEFSTESAPTLPAGRQVGARVPIGALSVEKVPASYHQPRETLLLDLSRTEDEILASMHEKTRYNIRLAERKGVVVSVERDPDVFWKLLAETTTRDEFSPHAKSYYETMLRTLTSVSIPHLNPPPARPAERGKQREENRCEAQLFVARFDGRPLAAAIVVSFGKTATYLHGASSDTNRNVMAPHLLHWRIIQDAKRRGFSFYDFWGIDEHRWPGVTRFKLGFGGERESYPAAFDLPLRPVWYRMYRIGRKIMKYRS